MPRSQWSGSISFGLVNIPVKLFSAVAPQDVRFHLLHDADHARIRQKRVCSLDGEEVSREHLLRGYELTPAHYVTVTDSELEALDPKATHTIEITEFVRAEEIDPVYFDHSYLLAPEETARRPYALLLQAMTQAHRIAIGRIVLRTKQYLAAIRAHGPVLMLATLYFADELVPADSLPNLPDPEALPDARELAMAAQLIDSLTEPFAPGKYHDEYRKQVLALIERKATGEQFVVPAQPAAPAKVVNLMEALEASIAKTKRREAPPKSRSTSRKKA